MLSQRFSLSGAWIPVTFGLLAVLLGGATGVAVVWLGKPLWAVAGVLGMFVALTSMLNAEVGLLGLLFITFIRLSDVLVKFYGAPSIAKPFIGLMLVGIALRWFFYRRPPRGWLRAALLVALWGVMVFTSLIYATNFDRSYNALDDFIKDGLIAVIVVVLVQRKGMFRWSFWALIGAGLFMGALSVYQYLTGSYSNTYGGFAQASLMNIVGQSSDYRIGGPYNSPNVFAQIMVALIPLALERLFAERNWLLKLLAGVSVAMIALAVIFTFSRSGFISLALAVGIFLLMRRTQFGTYVLLAALALALISFAPAQYTDRLSTLTDLFSSPTAVQTEYSFRGRASEAMVGWMMFLDHPLLGVGAKNYAVYYQAYSRQLGIDPRAENRSAASLYIEIAAEEGLMGIVVFSILIFSVYSGLNSARRTFERLKKPDMVSMTVAVAISMTVYLSSALFINSAYPRPFWILVGLSLAFPVFAQTLSESHFKRADHD
ncbi:MAG: hypothetical protein Fur0035_15080 [Anaerolineales bacterium]